jgi:hypothetical protein
VVIDADKALEMMQDKSNADRNDQSGTVPMPSMSPASSAAEGATPAPAEKDDPMKALLDAVKADQKASGK